MRSFEDKQEAQQFIRAFGFRCVSGIYCLLCSRPITLPLQDVTFPVSFCTTSSLGKRFVPFLPLLFSTCLRLHGSISVYLYVFPLSQCTLACLCGASCVAVPNISFVSPLSRIASLCPFGVILGLLGIVALQPVRYPSLPVNPTPPVPPSCVSLRPQAEVPSKSNGTTNPTATRSASEALAS